MLLISLWDLRSAHLSLCGPSAVEEGGHKDDAADLAADLAGRNSEAVQGFVPTRHLGGGVVYTRRLLKYTRGVHGDRLRR